MSALRRRAALVHDECKPLSNSCLDLMASFQVYQPASVTQAVSETHFTRREICSIYRGFKASALKASMTRDGIREMFAEMFPQGDSEHYADLVFATFRKTASGCVPFLDFVKCLSVLCRGDLEEKLLWIYKLYDPDDAGKVTWHRIFYVLQAIDDLVGIKARPRYTLQEQTDRTNQIFDKFDIHDNGVIVKEDFLEVCRNDPNIRESIKALNTILPT
uniref:EF-hand domain-containing protein n=1 Tax=Steinernema glaseri TaxID=37863 RepID=A0A1I8AP41_9BILA